jgi:hypothetical protein
LLCSMGRNLQLSSRAQEEEDSKRKTEYFFFWVLFLVCGSRPGPIILSSN